MKHKKKDINKTLNDIQIKLSKTPNKFFIRPFLQHVFVKKMKLNWHKMLENVLYKATEHTNKSFRSVSFYVQLRLCSPWVSHDYLKTEYKLQFSF